MENTIELINFIKDFEKKWWKEKPEKKAEYCSFFVEKNPHILGRNHHAYDNHLLEEKTIREFIEILGRRWLWDKDFTEEMIKKCEETHEIWYVKFNSKIYYGATLEDCCKGILEIIAEFKRIREKAEKVDS